MEWIGRVCNDFRKGHLSPAESNELFDEKQGFYGVIVSQDGRVLLERYVGNDAQTRFRLFSSLSKPVTALAVILLVQDGLLSLDTTMQQLGIEMPCGDSITIWHLLDHRSGMHDFVTRLYFHREPADLFHSLVEGCSHSLHAEHKPQQPLGEPTQPSVTSTSYLSPVAALQLIRNGPPGRILERPHYNNAGYDLLGYIIFLVSRKRTDVFVRERVFEPLAMHSAGFQLDENPLESMPYDVTGQPGIKEQQNWHCGNAFVVCALRDAHHFLHKYQTLLTPQLLATYRALCFFHCKGEERTLIHTGSGDFSFAYAAGREGYQALSRSVLIDMRRNGSSLKLVVAQNRESANSVLATPVRLGNRAAVEGIVFN